jgi:hypothetical protein
MKTKVLFRENVVAISMVMVMSLILIGATLTWLNKQKIVETTHLKLQAEEVKQRLDMIFGVALRKIDLGIRGYALTKNVQLLNPMVTGIKENETNLRKLDSLLRIQKLDTSLLKFNTIRKGIEDYIEFSKVMKKEVERDSMNTFVKMLNKDIGYDLWRLFEPFSKSHLAYEDALITKAQSDYEAALNRNIIIQIILVLLGLPSLAFIIYITNKERKNRQNLIAELEENNRKYLFNAGVKLEVKSLKDVIGNSIDNFKMATSFIKAISSKNYDAQWHGLDQSNYAKNTDNLSGELIKMRDQMKLAKQDDDRRFWMNEGLAQFSLLVRNQQANLIKLTEEATFFLTKYLGAQQGTLFLKNEENPTDPYLELIACYAFEKKKYVTKRIEIGDGLVGQTYLEGEPVLLKKVPPNYIHITSGLGQASPTCVCIIPMKHNSKTEVLLELATFRFFEPYQIEFLQKAGIHCLGYS